MQNSGRLKGGKRNVNPSFQKLVLLLPTFSSVKRSYTFGHIKRIMHLLNNGMCKKIINWYFN